MEDAVVRQIKDTAVKVVELNKKYQTFLRKFNEIVGTRVKGDDKSERQLRKLFKRGYSMKEIVSAIYAASQDSNLMGENDRGTRYLTPEYITRQDKFTWWLSEFDSKLSTRIV